MDPTQFFTASRLIIVAGKGGVGKTTVSAALAVAASRCGLSVQLIGLDGTAALPQLLGLDTLDYEPVEVRRPGSARIEARRITPDAALLDYLADHGLKRIANRMVRTGILEIVSTATPGIRDLLVLGKIRQLEQQRRSDVMILDAPAAGHAISFLRSPAGIADAAPSGALNTQAHEALALLGDPTRSQVMLVALPEATPVNELIETAFSLEDDVGIMLGPVVVNGVWPTLAGLSTPLDDAPGADELSRDDLASLAAAGAYRRERTELQTAEIARLADELPLPRIELGFRFTDGLGADDVDSLADELLQRLAALSEPVP